MAKASARKVIDMTRPAAHEFVVRLWMIAFGALIVGAVALSVMLS
jgi:hypothetical protein